MLEHLDGADEFEASVLERQLIRRSGLEREVGSASVLPFVLQPDVVGVDAEHRSRLEPAGEAFGDYSLAAAQRPWAGGSSRGGQRSSGRGATGFAPSSFAVAFPRGPRNPASVNGRLRGDEGRHGGALAGRSRQPSSPRSRPMTDAEFLGP